MNVEPDLTYTTAQEKMAHELSRLQEVWGPRNCEHGDWSVCEEECVYGDTQPALDVVLGEFIVVGAFMSMKTGVSTMNAISGPKQPMHHTRGLLWEALNEW